MLHCAIAHPPMKVVVPCRCLCKLLDGIQDHYTYAQPGIQRCVFQTQELVRCEGGMHGGHGRGGCVLRTQ